MSSFKLNWKGDAVERKVLGGLQNELNQSADTIAKSAAGNAPVDTGKHKSSIHSEHGGGKRPIAKVVGGPLTAFLEWGTKKMKPRKHIYPALDQETPAFRRRIEGKFK